MKRWILLGLLAAPFLASSQIAEQQVLKDWGFSYCLSHFSHNQEIKQDAGAAMEIYFQRGSHQPPAYSQIKHYIAQAFKASNAANSHGDHLTLYKCLSIYNSEPYQQAIAEMR